MDRHGNINSQLCNLVSVSLSAESDRYHGVFTIQVIVIYFLALLNNKIRIVLCGWYFYQMVQWEHKRNNDWPGNRSNSGKNIAFHSRYHNTNEVYTVWNALTVSWFCGQNSHWNSLHCCYIFLISFRRHFHLRKHASIWFLTWVKLLVVTFPLPPLHHYQYHKSCRL